MYGFFGNLYLDSNSYNFKSKRIWYIWFFGEKTWTSILIYIIWKNASKKLVKYYETDPNPKRLYSWTQKVEKSKKIPHLVFGPSDTPNSLRQRRTPIFLAESFSPRSNLPIMAFSKTWPSSSAVRFTFSLKNLACASCWPQRHRWFAAKSECSCSRERPTWALRLSSESWSDTCQRSSIAGCLGRCGPPRAPAGWPSRQRLTFTLKFTALKCLDMYALDGVSLRELDRIFSRFIRISFVFFLS